MSLCQVKWLYLRRGSVCRLCLSVQYTSSTDCRRLPAFSQLAAPTAQRVLSDNVLVRAGSTLLVLGIVQSELPFRLSIDTGIFIYLINIRLNINFLSAFFLVHFRSLAVQFDFSFLPVSFCPLIYNSAIYSRFCHQIRAHPLLFYLFILIESH